MKPKPFFSMRLLISLIVALVPIGAFWYFGFYSLNESGSGNENRLALSAVLVLVGLIGGILAVERMFRLVRFILRSPILLVLLLGFLGLCCYWVGQMIPAQLRTAALKNLNCSVLLQSAVQTELNYFTKVAKDSDGPFIQLFVKRFANQVCDSMDPQILQVQIFGDCKDMSVGSKMSCYIDRFSRIREIFPRLLIGSLISDPNKSQVLQKLIVDTAKQTKFSGFKKLQERMQQAEMNREPNSFRSTLLRELQNLEKNIESFY